MGFFAFVDAGAKLLRGCLLGGQRQALLLRPSRGTPRHRDGSCQAPPPGHSACGAPQSSRPLLSHPLVSTSTASRDKDEPQIDVSTLSSHSSTAVGRQAVADSAAPAFPSTHAPAEDSTMAWGTARAEVSNSPGVAETVPEPRSYLAESSQMPLGHRGALGTFDQPLRKEGYVPTVEEIVEETNRLRAEMEERSARNWAAYLRSREDEKQRMAERVLVEEHADRLRRCLQSKQRRASRATTARWCRAGAGTGTKAVAKHGSADRV